MLIRKQPFQPVPDFRFRLLKNQASSADHCNFTVAESDHAFFGIPEFLYGFFNRMNLKKAFSDARLVQEIVNLCQYIFYKSFHIHSGNRSFRPPAAIFLFLSPKLPLCFSAPLFRLPLRK